MPFTPLVIRAVGVISVELNLIQYPASVIKISGSSLIKVTAANSSPSLIVTAPMPLDFLVLTYSLKAVFLTKPFLVTNNTYLASVSL